MQRARTSRGWTPTAIQNEQSLHSRADHGTRGGIDGDDDHVHPDIESRGMHTTRPKSPRKRWIGQPNETVGHTASMGHHLPRHVQAGVFTAMQYETPNE